MTPAACRNPACAATLEPSWAFCPVCGTQTSGIDGVTDLTAVIAAACAGEYEVSFTANGPRPVAARMEWLDVPDGLEPMPPRASASACVVRFRLCEGFPCAARTLLAVLLSDDGPRTHRWRLRQERRQGFRLHLRPQTAGRLACNEQAVVLHWDAPARDLHLRNEGGRPLRLRALEAPPGVEVTDIAGRPLDETTVPHWSLEPAKEALLGVRLRTGTAACAAPQLRLVPSEGEAVAVHLFLPTESRGGFRPRFVVGVDVGTENVSVYCRDLVDDSVFPVGLEASATRMPCYLAFDEPSSEEPAAYGKSAVDRLVLGRGVVVRDLKVHLRHGRQSYATMYGEHFRTENLLYHLLSHVKEKVDGALEAHAGAVAAAHWSFTLPVLADAAAFETLRRKYRAVLKRVFRTEIRDGRVDPDEAFGFLTEPESAALYVFQRLGQDVPALLPRPFRDGDVVAVLDAGAGTTDIALMRMRIQQGQQTFEIIGEVGTDLPAVDGLQAEEFGGRSADLALVECLARASLKGGHATPENVTRQMGLLLGQGTGDLARARNRALQAAMEAKHQLCVPGDAARRIDVRERAWPDLDRTVPGEITLRRFHVTVAPALDRILARMEELIGRCGLTRRDVSWVFAIGGSSNIPLVEERLQGLFPGRVISLEGQRDVRMEAVARGAVWSWRARLRNVAPVDVVLQVRRGADVHRQPLLFRDRPLSMRPQEVHFDLVEDAQVELLGMGDGQAWRLTGVTVRTAREPRDLAIKVFVEDGGLRLEARVDGEVHVAPTAWLA